MIARFTNGGAGGTITQATGSNDGPGLLKIGAIAAVGYFVVKRFL